ncbi:MAG: signal transduction histidine kinase [Myxococcota bacterium]|jgi:signal transduction histidine kinase
MPQNRSDVQQRPGKCASRLSRTLLEGQTPDRGAHVRWYSTKQQCNRFQMSATAQIPVLVVADEAYVGQDDVAHEIGEGFDVQVVAGIDAALTALQSRPRPLVLLPHNLAPESGESVLARCARTGHPFLGLLMVDTPDLPALSAGSALPGVHAILPRPLTPQTLRLHLLAAGATRHALEQATARAEQPSDIRTLIRHLRHEVRGQAQGMVGVAGLLQQFEGERLSAEGINWCGRLQTSGAKLSKLVDDLVAWLRLGADTPEPTWVDVHAMAEDIAYRLNRQRSIAAHVRCEGPTLKVFADRRALETALGALFDNALTYTDATTPEITVRVTPDVTHASHRVEVHDNGLGFPDDGLPRLLGLFERHHFETREPMIAGGNGVGLTLVERAVASHGGEVTIQPNAETGTHISLRFPDAPR